MSHKRRKQNSADAHWFVYAPGSVVPRDATHVLVHHSVEFLPDEVFQGCRDLKELKLPEGLLEIGAYALCNYESLALEHITLPSTLTKIGECALANCTSLSEVVFPEGLTQILISAFQYCTSLGRIRLPSTLTTIAGGAFASCTSLKVVHLADGIRTIGRSAFQGCALEDIILPATVARICVSAFYRCRSLRMIKLCGGIQMISEGAFDDCTLVDHVTVQAKALIVTGTQGNQNLCFAAAGTFSLSDFPQVVIASECFISMHAADVAEVERGVTKILGLEEEWDAQRERLLAFLAPYELRHKQQATALLELGLWKARLQASQGVNTGLGREECRVNCGAAIIVPHVVSFL